MRAYGSKTERERQANVASILGRGLWFTYRLMDGSVDRAFAMTEPGAFRVMNAEHPGQLCTLVDVSGEAVAS